MLDLLAKMQSHSRFKVNTFYNSPTVLLPLSIGLETGKISFPLGERQCLKKDISAFPSC